MPERTGENERRQKKKVRAHGAGTDSPVQDGIADLEHLDFCTHCKVSGDISEMIICNGCSVRRHNNEECNDGSCGTLGCRGTFVSVANWLNLKLDKQRALIKTLTARVDDLEKQKEVPLQMQRSQVREMVANTLNSPVAWIGYVFATISVALIANYKIIEHLKLKDFPTTEDKIMGSFLTLGVEAVIAYIVWLAAKENKERKTRAFIDEDEIEEEELDEQDQYLDR